MTDRRRGRLASGGRGSGRGAGATSGGGNAIDLAGKRQVARRRGREAVRRRLAEERDQPLQPARVNRRRAAALLGAGDEDAGAGHRHGEIVGGKADAAFGRRQADLGAHGARQPGVGAGLGRPDAFVEAAEDDEIDRLQAGFERPPDLDPRLGADRPGDRHRGHQGGEEGGKFGRCQDETGALLAAGKAGEQPGERGAILALPQARIASGLVAGRSGESLEEKRRSPRPRSGRHRTGTVRPPGRSIRVRAATRPAARRPVARGETLAGGRQVACPLAVEVRA